MEYVIGSIIGIIIWSYILEGIISNGSGSKFISRQLRLQTELLAKIAERQGVDANEIADLIEPKVQKRKGRFW